MRNPLHGLDWRTPLGSVSLNQHWRIGLSVIALASLATVLWHLLFPHTDPFMKLWAGCTTGSAAGALVGAYWQLRADNRRSETSGPLLLMSLVAWGAFALISLGVIGPSMQAEEALRLKMRSLPKLGLVSVHIEDSQGRLVVVDDQESIRHLCDLARHADLFYRSHEGSLEEYEVWMSFRNRALWCFRAGIPERHPNDLALQIIRPGPVVEIIIPFGRHWMSSALGGAIRQQGDQPDRGKRRP